MKDHAHLARLARALMLAGVALLLSLAWASLAFADTPAFTAPSEVANQAGRLDTVSLTDLGGHTASLSTFVSDGSSFTNRLCWTSARGRLDAARCKLASGDLNNDGFPDAVVLYDLGKGRSALLTFLSSGTTFVKASAWQGSLSWAASRLAVGDASGDGADDVFVLSGKGKRASSAVLFTASTTSSTAAPAPVNLTRSTLAARLLEAAATTQIAAADVNADGRAELVSLVAVSKGQARLDVLAAGQVGWTSSTFWRGALSATKTRFACADVDSDGRADAVLFAAAGSGSRLSVLASRGTSFAAPAVWWQGPAATAPFALTKLALGDVSGDGRADAVLLTSTSATKATLTVAVSSGSAFSPQLFWSGSLKAARTQLACAPFSPTVVPSTTKSLDEATIAALASVSADGSVYQFASLTPQLATVRLGDVIVAPPCPSAPEGLLRKVTAVSDEGRTLTTEAASLEEAFSSAEVSLHHAVRPADLGAPTQALPGVRLVRTRDGRALGKITISLKDVKIESVKLDGQISIEQDYDFTFDVGWDQANWYSLPTPKLKTLSFIQTTTQTNELRLSAPIAKVGIKEEVLISFPLATIVVPVAGVPVTITPTLEVRVGVDGKIEAGITTAVTETNVLRLGATYENGSFHAVQKFTPSATFEPPNLKVTAELEAYAKANLLLAIYGTAGPYAGAKAYVKLAADPAATPWWSLRYGVDASLGFEVKVFSHLLVDWSYEKNLYDKEIAHAQDPGPGPSDVWGVWVGTWTADEWYTADGPYNESWLPYGPYPMRLAIHPWAAATGDFGDTSAPGSDPLLLSGRIVSVVQDGERVSLAIVHKQPGLVDDWSYITATLRGDVLWGDWDDQKPAPPGWICGRGPFSVTRVGQ